MEDFDHLFEEAAVINYSDALVPLPDSLQQFSSPSSSYSLFCDDIDYYLLPPLPCSKQIFNFDDIDLDAFTCKDSTENKANYNIGEGKNIIWKRRKTEGRLRLSEVGYEDMRRYFCMPISAAAKEMKVGLTQLKKRCRELGIPRWPHRKIKSLRSLIINFQCDLGKKSMMENPSLKIELERLEEQKRLMEESPQVELTQRTKKLRQAFFKANYKKRRTIDSLYS